MKQGAGHETDAAILGAPYAVRVETDEGPVIAIAGASSHNPAPDYVGSLHGAIAPLPPPTSVERYAKALERAIEAEGYRIMVDPFAEKITLERREPGEG